MLSQKEITEMDNGLIACPFHFVGNIMPELKGVMHTFPDSGELYLFDVKVHMLMPNQYPCIPNWHYDFIPRDENGEKQPHLVDPSKKMFMWLSGPPLTEFRDGREVVPNKWIEFTQLDEHRCVESEDFQWRVFIRAFPYSIAPKHVMDLPFRRRHTQVYLDAEKFTW